MDFPKKTIKQQTFLTEGKKYFLQKKKRKKKRRRRKKMKKRKKTIKERIEIFQENKRKRNLKAINCQISKSFFFLSGDLFMYFIFHL